MGAASIISMSPTNIVLQYFTKALAHFSQHSTCIALNPKGHTKNLTPNENICQHFCKLILFETVCVDNAQDAKHCNVCRSQLETLKNNF